MDKTNSNKIISVSSLLSTLVINEAVIARKKNDAGE